MVHPGIGRNQHSSGALDFTDFDDMPKKICDKFVVKRSWKTLRKYFFVCEDAFQWMKKVRFHLESNNSGDFPGFTLAKLTPFCSSNLISLRRNQSPLKTPNMFLV